jgi:hypothetical protein
LDASAFMQIAIGVFFLALAVGTVIALLRLSTVFREAGVMVHDVNQEAVPILTRLQTTVDEVNSELGKIDEITGSVVVMTEKIETATGAIETAIETPVKKVASVSAGISEALSRFLGGRGKES